jgi:hypothetical protein
LREHRSVRSNTMVSRNSECVGGSITIPHLRRAVATLDELEAATGDLG